MQPSRYLLTSRAILCKKIRLTKKKTVFQRTNMSERCSEWWSQNKEIKGTVFCSIFSILTFFSVCHKIPFPFVTFYSLFVLALVISVGLLLNILACALYHNWWPLFVGMAISFSLLFAQFSVFAYFLAPLPNLICGACNRGYEETYGQYVISVLVIHLKIYQRLQGCWIFLNWNLYC